MLFLSVEDFFQKASKNKPYTREEEKALAKLMASGDLSAREKLTESYLNYVASTIKKTHKEMQTLTLVYNCLNALEKSVKTFNFMQDSESFSHRLSLVLRKEITAYIANL